MKKKILTLTLTFLSVCLVSFAGDRFGDMPDAKHAWAVHDMHRPLPPKVNVPDSGIPSDAIVLFDGTEESVRKNWCDEKGNAPTWKVVDGEFRCVPRKGSVYTREKFADVQLHIEWLCSGQDNPHFANGRGNSGVLMMGRYEIQVIDASDQYAGSGADEFTYADGIAGAIYGQYPPLVNAARACNKWQSYDIVFHPPRWKGNVLVDTGSFTVFHNGVLVQDAQSLEGGTTWRRRIGFTRHPPEDRIRLQDHGNPVPYRNIWIRRIAPRQVSVDIAANHEKVAAELFAKLDPKAKATPRNLILAAEVLYYSRKPEYLAHEKRLREEYERWLRAADEATLAGDDFFHVWDAYDVFARNGDNVIPEEFIRLLNEKLDKKGWRQERASAPASEVRILAALKGTPSEMERPRDILVNKPDYVVFVPKQSRDVAKRDPSRPGDTYNDHFQVIANPSNGWLYAFWTQASREGDVDQHIAFSRSQDKGRSWSEPVVLAGSPNKRNPMLIASWQQPMLAKSGRLYCLWNQRTTNGGALCGMMFGAFSDDDGATWSAPKLIPFAERMDADPKDPLVPPTWCNWQRPLRLGEGGRFFVGCSRHGRAPYDKRSGCKIEFWEFQNIDDNPPVQDIRIKYLSANRSALSAFELEKAGGFRASEPALEEASVVKLPDGRLFALMRSSIGSPVWSQSRDGGRSWSSPKILRDCEGRPFLHPRSPCPMYDWKGPESASGMYFALVHQTFDFNEPKGNAYQNRGPLYLIAGVFDPAGEQPVKFAAPKLFAPRPSGNSFYASYCMVDGKGVLWFNDSKFYLLGRIIGPEWF